jgi:hypothetical protein
MMSLATRLTTLCLYNASPDPLRAKDVSGFYEALAAWLRRDRADLLGPISVDPLCNSSDLRLHFNPAGAPPPTGPFPGVIQLDVSRYDEMWVWVWRALPSTTDLKRVDVTDISGPWWLVIRRWLLDYVVPALRADAEQATLRYGIRVLTRQIGVVAELQHCAALVEGRAA